MASHPRHDKSRLTPPPPRCPSPAPPPAILSRLCLFRPACILRPGRRTPLAPLSCSVRLGRTAPPINTMPPRQGRHCCFHNLPTLSRDGFLSPQFNFKCYCAINGELPYCTSNGSPVTRGKSLPARNTIFRLPPSPYIWTFTSSSANLKTRRSASGQLSSSGK